MLEILSETARRIYETMMDAARGTPVEVLLSVLMSAVAIAHVYGYIGSSEYFFFPAVLAWILTFSISALHRLGVVDCTTRWLLTGAYLAGTGVYAVYFFDTQITASVWRYGLFLAGSFFAVTLVPILSKMSGASASERFWRFNMRLLFRLAVAAVFTTGVFAGVSSVLAVSQELFSLSIDDKVYMSLALLSFVTMGGILVAGGLEEISRIDLEFHAGGLTWIGRLGTFLAVPLTLAYLAIIYLYLAQVFFSGESPSNILSPLMLSAGIFGYAGLFVLWPFIEKREAALLNSVLRWFPAALLPTLPVAVWAIVERVEQYGWTEFRYIRLASVICLGLFSTVALVRVIQRRSFSLTAAPVILAGASLFAAVGPWSAIEVSERSQKARLVESAKELGFWKDGKLEIDTDSTADPDTLEEFRTSMAYLVETHGVDSIQAFSTVDLARHGSSYDVLTELGVNELADANQLKRTIYREWQSEPWLIEARGRMHEFNLYDDRQEVGDWSIFIRDQKLVLSRDDITQEIDLSSLVTLVRHEKKPTFMLTRDELTFSLGEPQPTIQVFIRNIRFANQNGWKIERIDGKIILPDSE